MSQSLLLIVFSLQIVLSCDARSEPHVHRRAENAGVDDAYHTALGESYLKLATSFRVLLGMHTRDRACDIDTEPSSIFWNLWGCWDEIHDAENEFVKRLASGNIGVEQASSVLELAHSCRLTVGNLERRYLESQSDPVSRRSSRTLEVKTRVIHDKIAGELNELKRSSAVTSRANQLAGLAITVKEQSLDALRTGKVLDAYGLAIDASRTVESAVALARLETAAGLRQSGQGLGPEGRDDEMHPEVR